MQDQDYHSAKFPSGKGDDFDDEDDFFDLNDNLDARTATATEKKQIHIKTAAAEKDLYLHTA